MQRVIPAGISRICCSALLHDSADLVARALDKSLFKLPAEITRLDGVQGLRSLHSIGAPPSRPPGLRRGFQLLAAEYEGRRIVQSRHGQVDEGADALGLRGAAAVVEVGAVVRADVGQQQRP